MTSRIATLLLPFVLMLSPAIAHANCEPPDHPHGGTAFLAPLAGDWDVLGNDAGAPFAGYAEGAMRGDTLRLDLHRSVAPLTGLASLSLRYDARCDDFVAVREERTAKGQIRSLGRGVSRGNALDVTFPGPSGEHRTDIALSWDERRATWTLQMARELSEGHWETYASLRLKRVPARD
jgi:hypothetical protein